MIYTCAAGLQLPDETWEQDRWLQDHENSHLRKIKLEAQLVSTIVSASHREKSFSIALHAHFAIADIYIKVAYKRNPMRLVYSSAREKEQRWFQDSNSCERICGLGRHLANLNKDCSDTFAAQWFEVRFCAEIHTPDSIING